MLALRRKQDQKIRVGKDVVIQILEIAGDTVLVGIECPKHIDVDREEVYERKQIEGVKKKRV